MYRTIQIIHSYWAYLVVLVIILATVNALFGYFGKRPYAPRDFRVSLFALICSHLQLLIGLILFFFSPFVQWFQEGVDVGAIMKNDQLRLYNVEHPLLMIIAVILITVGYSKHKKKLPSESKFKTLSIFYTLALAAVLLMIPWNAWFW